MIAVKQLNELDLANFELVGDLIFLLQPFDPKMALDDFEYLGGLWDVQEVPGVTVHRAANANWHVGSVELLVYDDESAANIETVAPALKLPFSVRQSLAEVERTPEISKLEVSLPEHSPNVKIARFDLGPFEFHLSFDTDECRRIELRHPPTVKKNDTGI